MTPPRFDALAPHYRWMERVSFGRRLHACRTAMLDRMTAGRRALVLGDGDGRFLAELLRANPAVRVDAIDGSPAMTAAAERRAKEIPGAAERVRFLTADARTVRLPPAAFDLIVTHFFLDCFPRGQLAPLIARTADALAPGGLWVVGDFRVPEGGLPRFLGRLALLGMYTFFRCVTGLPAGRLVNPDPFLRARGLRPDGVWTTLGGFLACTAWRKPSPADA
jgi:SAM-dependent methyltransferase